ncbi:CapA family protein [Pseudomonas lini]
MTSIKVDTSYETRGPHQPVRIRTEPDSSDLANLVEDIKKLKGEVDVVILAFHSGVIRLPRVISDYQVTVAHAAIDAGADMVVCHAPHIPKAIEMYKGKAVFYSLGVFAMTKSFPAPSWSEPAWSHGAVRNHADLDPEYPFYALRQGLYVELARQSSGDQRRHTKGFVPSDGHGRTVSA